MRSFAAQGIREYPHTVSGIRTAVAGFDGLYPLAPDIRVEEVTAPTVRGEWITAPQSRPERLVLYIHGGCYISGSPATVRECCSRIARVSEARVLNLEYRLAPENPFPAALDDVMAAYGWLLENGYDAGNITIAGESAGGGLTLATLMRIRDEARWPLPALGVPISAWVDLTLQHESLRRNVGRDIASALPLEIGAREYVPESDLRRPHVSPLFGDLRGLPPLLVQVGGGELLLDDSLALAYKARREGVDVTLQVWPDMIHVWHWFASELDEGIEAIDSIGIFIKRRISAASGPSASE
jgi:acetyl esterase/lipase